MGFFFRPEPRKTLIAGKVDLYRLHIVVCIGGLVGYSRRGRLLSPGWYGRPRSRHCVRTIFTPLEEQKQYSIAHAWPRCRRQSTCLLDSAGNDRRGSRIGKPRSPRNMHASSGGVLCSRGLHAKKRLGFVRFVVLVPDARQLRAPRLRNFRRSPIYRARGKAATLKLLYSFRARFMLPYSRSPA